MQDRGFNSFASNVIKLSANETKWSSLLARTRALILYISIWMCVFGPEKLPGLSRNGHQLPRSPRKKSAFRDDTTTLAFPRNDVWETRAEILYWWRVTIQILILSRGICFYQSEALPRSGYCQVIRMEFLQSLLRRHPVETSCGVGCFLRLGWLHKLWTSSQGRVLKADLRNLLRFPTFYATRSLSASSRAFWLSLKLTSRTEVPLGCLLTESTNPWCIR